MDPGDPTRGACVLKMDQPALTIIEVVRPWDGLVGRFDAVADLSNMYADTYVE